MDIESDLMRFLIYLFVYHKFLKFKSYSVAKKPNI